MRVKRWSVVVFAAAVLLLLGKHVLLDTAAEPGAPYVIDVAALHRAATAAGRLPESIEVERIGTFVYPRSMVVAGGGLRTHPMVLLSHRVLWSDHSLVIDTGMPQAGSKKMPGGKIDGQAFARVEEALKTATIVFTHEHGDHVGGAARTRDFPAIAKQIRMTREQLESPKLERRPFPPGALASLTPLDYKGLYTLEPGVVLQKAPGHSPGSQLIYVELANGTRFLFVGDIAWTHDNIAQQTGRPLLAELFMGEDRAAVAAQLQALAHLPPDIHVIAAHDSLGFERDLEAGLYRRGFSGLPSLEE